MIYLIVFYLGAIMGSYIGMLSYRLPLGKPIILTRSRCELCEEELKLYELLPVFSFLIQDGKCRTCQGKINKRIFYIEIINGLIFIILFLNLKFSLEYGIGIIFVEILFLVSLIDLDYKIIPNGLSLLIFIISVLKSIVEGDLLRKLVTAIIFLLVVTILYKLTDEAFGMGDIKIFIGLIFFWSRERFLLNLILSLLVASLYSIYKILTKRLTSKDSIAFGPFIFIGFIISLTVGDILINIYFKMTM